MREDRYPEVSHEPVTRLIIEKDAVERATNESSGKGFQVNAISISRSDQNQGYDYYRLKDLSNTKFLSVFLREQDQTKEVALPEVMLERMAYYMANKAKMKGPFDCVSFAHMINGIPYEFGKYNSANWEMTPFNGYLNVGDTISICNSDSESRRDNHFAIYVGDGLYLSKFGGPGPLIVTDLTEMKKGFDGDLVYKMKPLFSDRNSQEM